MGTEPPKAIRIRMHLESETLSFPELRQFIGKNVEITVEEEIPASRKETLAALEALRDIPYDFDALWELREASKI